MWRWVEATGRHEGRGVKDMLIYATTRGRAPNGGKETMKTVRVIWRVTQIAMSRASINYRLRLTLHGFILSIFTSRIAVDAVHYAGLRDVARARRLMTRRDAAPGRVYTMSLRYYARGRSGCSIGFADSTISLIHRRADTSGVVLI